MNTLQDAIKYAPGFTGYGTKGLDGSMGLNGISLYFSGLNGATDYSLISNAIYNNNLLNSNDVHIPGYPIRTYQDGDYFIDITSEIYVIDKTASPYYKKTGLKLNTFGLFEDTQIVNSFGFRRYSNIVSTVNKNIIDTVYANSNANYSASPLEIYGIKPENYGKIFYCNINSSVYNPFMVFTTGNFSDNAMAIVKKSTQDATDFHIGNIASNGQVKNTRLIFDVNQIMINRDASHRITDNSPLGTILTTNEIFAPYLFNGEKVTKSYFDASTTSTSAILNWDKTKFLNSDESAVYNKIKCDLIFYAPSNIDGSSFDYNNPYNNSVVFEDIDVSGSITITGLQDGQKYKSYLKFYENGWIKTSDIIDCATNLIPSLRLFRNGSELSNAQVIDLISNSSGTVLIFDLSTNIGDWTTNITGSSIYTTVLPKTGNGNGQIRVTIGDNNIGSTDRINSLVIASTQYNISFTVNIKQAAFVPSLVATPNAISFTKNASNSVVGITTNLGNWNFTVSEPWISVNAPNGTSGNAQLNIAVPTNIGVARSGNINVVSVSRGDISTNITISQQVGYETGIVSFRINPSAYEADTDLLRYMPTYINNSKTFATPRELTFRYIYKARLYPYGWNLTNITTIGLLSYTYNGDKVLKTTEINSYIKTPSDLNYTMIQGDDEHVEVPTYPGDVPIIITIDTQKVINTSGISTADYPHHISLSRPYGYRRLQDASMSVELVSSKIAGTEVYDTINPAENKVNMLLKDPSLFINVYDIMANPIVLINSFNVVGSDTPIRYGIISSGWTEMYSSDPSIIVLNKSTFPGATSELGDIHITFKPVQTEFHGTIYLKRGLLSKQMPVTINPVAPVTPVTKITLYDSNSTPLLNQKVRFDEWTSTWDGSITAPSDWNAKVVYDQSKSINWLDYPSMGSATDNFNLGVGRNIPQGESRYAEVHIKTNDSNYEYILQVDYMGNKII